MKNNKKIHLWTGNVGSCICCACGYSYYFNIENARKSYGAKDKKKINCKKCVRIIEKYLDK